ncbi:glycosyltransferase [Agromyces binzhouensis]|uniref:glycosyltransferase n=1 Tax=Agromyces binzhouensis TaxID=1817495 RepID=UPI003624E845
MTQTGLTEVVGEGTDGEPVVRGPRLVVLHSLLPPDGTSKYIDHMVDGASEYVDIRFISWKGALLGAYDVFHVHWPERLIRDRRRGRRFIKRRLLDLLLVRLALQRVPIVWTAHNLRPHEQGPPSEERSLERFTRSVTLVIRLNPTTDVPPGLDAVTIPHGHYRDRFAGVPRPAAEAGRLLHFGIIRPYKGVDTLLRAFGSLESDRLRLRIVGKPHPGQGELVEAAAAADPRITATLRAVDDAEVVDEICRSSLVVLPYRGEMHNSGVVLLALSLDRPVLVPASPTNAALSAEVGDGWVFQYEGELDGATILSALEEIGARDPRTSPRLAGRDVKRIGELHYDAYLRARRARRGR